MTDGGNESILHFEIPLIHCQGARKSQSMFRFLLFLLGSCTCGVTIFFPASRCAGGRIDQLFFVAFRRTNKELELVRV